MSSIDSKYVNVQLLLLLFSSLKSGRITAFSVQAHDSLKPLMEFFAWGSHFPLPWQLYRSVLPFSPTSSELFKHYGHLSDARIRIFSIFNEFPFGNSIPLSENTFNACNAKPTKLLDYYDANSWKLAWPDYKAEFLDADVRNGTVTCAALSHDGRYVALGFGSGIIQVADIDNQCTISQFHHDS